MVEQVAENIYRIGVPLPGNPLKELNSYFIRGTDSDLLIDTGFRRQTCQQALEEGLAELGSDPARRDVLLTHLHSDHAGMADLFVGPGRHVYMGKVDMERLDTFLRRRGPDPRELRFISEGFPTDLVRAVSEVNPASQETVPCIDGSFQGLEDGDVLRTGEYELKTLLVPGHTPGNCMFWVEEQGIMFSGDHILFDITPNITEWSGVDDALGAYLDSLRKVKDYPVKLTLPGHRKTGDYRARIEHLLSHHQKRLEEALSVVRAAPGLTAYEIAGKMTWKIRANSWEDFPMVQKWFAVGECLSHLDYLRRRDKVRREEKDGLWRYEAI